MVAKADYKLGQGVGLKNILQGLPDTLLVPFTHNRPEEDVCVIATKGRQHIWQRHIEKRHSSVEAKIFVVKKLNTHLNLALAV